MPAIQPITLCSPAWAPAEVLLHLGDLRRVMGILSSRRNRVTMRDFRVCGLSS
jgi:hypothetical protein